MKKNIIIKFIKFKFWKLCRPDHMYVHVISRDNLIYFEKQLGVGLKQNINAFDV